MSKVWNGAKEVVSDVKDSVGDIGEGIAKGAGAVVRVGTDVVAGRSTDDSMDRLGNAVNTGVSGYIGAATGGLSRNDTVNAYTGGSLDKLRSGYDTFGNLIAGKSVSQNIKDQASVLLQAGQAYVGANGVSVGGQDLSGFANNILGGLSNKINSQTGSSGGASPNPVNYSNPSQASYNGNVATGTNYLPYLLIGGIVLIGAVLLLKKKK